MAAGSKARNRYEQGRDIYNYRCYFCHGYAGDAKTLAATYLEPPPRNFTTTPLNKLPRERMIKSVTEGRMNTAMRSFKDLLTADEIEAVVDFIRTAFMSKGGATTRYHTEGNGWPNHERFAIAFPFATGEIALDTPIESLTPEQREGRELFMSSCITCHDRAKVADEGVAWDPRAVSYPRSGYSHTNPDAITGATPYAKHEVVPVVKDLTNEESRGEKLYQENCAFCHAPDGTAQNWIGSFLEPPPRNLTDATAMAGMSRERLERVIAEGLTDTSMPAWRGVFDQDQIEAVAAYVMRVFVPGEAKMD